jgi:hypothetical protein
VDRLPGNIGDRLVISVVISGTGYCGGTHIRDTQHLFERTNMQSSQARSAVTTNAGGDHPRGPKKPPFGHEVPTEMCCEQPATKTTDTVFIFLCRPFRSARVFDHPTEAKRPRRRLCRPSGPDRIVPLWLVCDIYSEIFEYTISLDKLSGPDRWISRNRPFSNNQGCKHASHHGGMYCCVDDVLAAR